MATEFIEAFGRTVRRLRRERGMTQADLAGRLGLRRTSITNLEKGQQNPPLSILPEIASALGVDPVELIVATEQNVDAPQARNLASTVHDENLRRWAREVIRDTLSTESQNMNDKQG